MDEKDEYILGTESEEIHRLHFQHKAWVEHAFRLFRRGGIRAGHRVVDLGCGPGFTSMELAHCVGPTGHVVACDRSARFLEYLKSQCEQRSLSWVHPALGDVEQLELPAASLDAAYARWLLCWVPDAAAVVANVARLLKPGGVLLLHEYLDWDAMKLIPASTPFRAAVDACMHSWVVGGATINIAEGIPELADRHGFDLEVFDPIARIGRVGSLEWQWVTGFLLSYLPKLVAQGLFTANALEAFRAELRLRGDDGSTRLYAPTMIHAVLRRRTD